MLSVVIPAAAGEEVGGVSFLLPPLYEVFWAAVTLLVILLLVGRYGLPRIYAALDERAARIQEGLDLADKARQQQADAQQQAAQLVEEARHEAARIREDAQGQAREILAQARREAQAEAVAIHEAAQRQIMADTQAAQISLRTDVGLLASSLAEQIVGEQLRDTDLSARVIDRFMDELDTLGPIGGVDDGAAAEELR
ncbi:F0F1 ATP synthase subunit B [Actinomyces sp. 2119]|uniref:F0F1 ATP synthase subunit B n=1 Tax=Actinomyces sp. 2119 TaxID=2321393 RepID=UPI000E6B7ABA|nr:F0F1 ATP synthase subunit B [Actinomyces sp. 2119]RJF41438.1 F0F1 ATP synthase subunit B [Actinomyces sp. 2119]